jgi:hypothetical protein
MFCVCPICGAWVKSWAELSPSNPLQHRCDKNVLAKIDGALESEKPRTRTPSLGERLNDGFQMLQEDEKS